MFAHPLSFYPIHSKKSTHIVRIVGLFGLNKQKVVILSNMIVVKNKTVMVGFLKTVTAKTKAMVKISRRNRKISREE